MRIRTRRSTPAHAPAWVRPRHWPAVVGVLAIATVAAALPTLHDGRDGVARPVAVAQPGHASAAHGGISSEAQVITADALPGVGTAGVTGGAVVADATPPATGFANAVAADLGDVAPGPENNVAPSDPATVSGLATGGIPATALEAYRRAATHEVLVDPGCHLPWPLLAGIGRVESNHGRYGGAVLLSDGTSTQHILGIPLDGSRSATITDTDGGRLDGDAVYDRALGPMQFIPSTWASYGADGNGDGRKDPFNIFDAAAAAAHYLCVAGGNLSTLAGQTRAVLAYNHSSDYLALVLNLEHAYAVGVPGLVVPVLPAQTAPAAGRPSTPAGAAPARPGGHKPPPPVDPGPPLSAPSGPRPPHPTAAPTSRSASKPKPTTATPTTTTPSTTSSTPAPTSSTVSTPPVTPPPPTCPSTSDAPSTDAPSSSDSTDSAAPPSESESESTDASSSASTSESSSGSASASTSASITCPPAANSR